VNRNVLVETFKIAASVAAGSFVYLYLSKSDKKTEVEA
jgi:hypothetical protein